MRQHGKPRSSSHQGSSIWWAGCEGKCTIAVRTLSCAYSNIWRPQTVAMRESRMTRNCHVRFGERSRETHLSQGRKVRSAPTLLSPILANIYLNKLDKYIEKTLLPKHNRGEGRVWSSEYMRIYNRMRRSKKSGNVEKYQEHRRQLQQLPSLDTTDPNFRRLRYIRYADDFLLGFIVMYNLARLLWKRTSE